MRLKKLVKEVGIVHNGVTLVSSPFNGFEKITKKDHAKSGLLYTAIQNSCKSIFSQDVISVKIDNFKVIFQVEEFAYLKTSEWLYNRNKSKNEEDYFLGYVVLEPKKKRRKRYVRKMIIPALKTILMKFTHKYFNSYFNDLTVFSYFKEVICEYFEKV